MNHLKNLVYLFVFLVVLSSCRTNKTVIESTSDLKSLSARKVIRKHQATDFDATSLDAKLKVMYVDSKGSKTKKIGLSVQLKIIKDSVIWLKGTKIVNVFRAKITPSSFSYYSPLDRSYFQGDYSLINKMLGTTDVSFSQLQNLFLGQSVLDLKGNKFESNVEENSYKLTPKSQEELYDIFFFIDPETFKLKKQVLMVNNSSQELRVTYDEYSRKENQFIPKRMTVNASEGVNFQRFQIDFRTVTLNKKITIPFKIPTGYKSLKI